MVVNTVPGYYAPNSGPITLPDEPSANLLCRPCDIGSSDHYTLVRLTINLDVEPDHSTPLRARTSTMIKI